MIKKESDNMAGEFIKKDGKVIVNVDLMRAYIPEALFNDEQVSVDIVHSAVASTFGDGFNVVGVFNLRYANGEDAAKKIDSTPLRTFMYPNIIETYPSNAYLEKISFNKEDEPEQYRVFEYNRGDIMMDAKIKKDTDNCTKFLDMINKGRIPSTVRYEDVYLAWVKNTEINDFNPKVMYLSMQYIIATLYKRRKRIDQQFRFEYGKNMNSNDYYTTNIRGSVASSSVFANQTFEHMGRMLGNAVNITRRGMDQESTPIEKVLYL